jgi:hypothetical protein
LKSPGAVTAVAGIQKTLAGLEKAYVDSDTGTGGAEEEPNFVVDLTYGLKPIGSFDREYISTYDYGKISSLLRPLVETGEFKAQFYSALYTKCAEPLIFIGRLDDKDVQTGKSGIINKNADKAAALTQALKKDVQANSLAYLLDDRTKYQFSVEITVPETLKNYGHVISDVYYIPDSFKNTIAYIKGHEAELFTQGK